MTESRIELCGKRETVSATPLFASFTRDGPAHPSRLTPTRAAMEYNMTTEAQAPYDQHLDLTAGIVCAFVSRNAVPQAELPNLIRETHAAIAGLGQAGAAAAAPEVEAEVAKPTAAQVRKSITPDAVISFIDGKPYKTLKRHLSTHGLDPYSYRQRYGLPDDYPMVAPSYSKARSALARSVGLGRGGVAAAA